MKKLIFIVNPAAKNGASLKIWRDLENKIDIPYEVHYTKAKNHARELAFTIANSTSCPILLIAVGGDGTIHEVVNGGISFNHVTLAFIPAGSGNDFARGYRLPTNSEKSLIHILKMIEEENEHFDAGYYEIDKKQGFFINSLGAGFDAVISHKANLSILKHWLNQISLGKLIYALYLIIELFCYQPGLMRIKINGKTYRFEKTWFVTVSNQPFYGGGMKIAPQAEPNDGILDITVVQQLSRLKLLFVFLSVFWGGHHRFKEVVTFKGEHIVIESEQPIPIHTDGEPAGITPVKITIRPQSWKMIKSNVVKSKITA